MNNLQQLKLMFCSQRDTFPLLRWIFFS